ncbi:MAG: hypothetical protein CL916_04390 [Deltaproteobacteria bacterium]|nr:hypothetical protein [Deltaproteobacteria bacterium]
MIEEMRRTVHQISFDVLFSRFPELQAVWFPLHQKWKDLCTNTSWVDRFQESQDIAQRKFFEETQYLPDVERYQRLEQLGEEQREAIEFGEGWYVNRGKIAYTRLAWLPSFEQRGVFWYPKGGYREWHSNFPYNEHTDRAGWRIYLVDVEEEGKSGFQYINKEGECTHCADKKGYANVFWLPHDRFFWHAVFSHTNRFSCGFHPLPHLNASIHDALLASSGL